MAGQNRRHAGDPKRAAAAAALKFVEPGMRLGLGTGSTAAWLVKLLGERVRSGFDVFCVPTSTRTRDLAAECGVRTGALDEAGWLDMTIDGADEFDDELNLIKGGGGALLQEKIVAAASDRMIVITDASKHVQMLGTFPLPVEVVPFGWEVTRSILEDMAVAEDVSGSQVSLRMNRDRPFVTDEGHYILDMHLRRIGDPARLSFKLNRVPGVVENGLFIGMADAVVIGRDDGGADILRSADSAEAPPRDEENGIFDDLE